MPLKSCVGLGRQRCPVGPDTPKQQTRTKRWLNRKVRPGQIMNGNWQKLQRRAEDCISPFPSHNSRGMAYGRLCWDSLYWIRASVVRCVTCPSCRSYIRRASVRRLAQGFTLALQRSSMMARLRPWFHKSCHILSLSFLSMLSMSHVYARPLVASSMCF